MSLFISINLLFSFLIFIFSEDTDNKLIEPVIEEFQLLEKYKSIQVSSGDGFFKFNSSDFKNNEIMHFKMKALNSRDNFYKEKASYEYINSVADAEEDDFLSVGLNSKISFEINKQGTTFKIRYFDIKKNNKEFRNTNGNLLLFEFYVREGVVEITNMKEGTENKLKDWMIVLIIVGVIIFVIIIIVIIIICVIKNNLKKTNKKKNNKKIQNNNKKIQEIEFKKKSKNNIIKNNKKEIKIYKKNKINNLNQKQEHSYINKGNNQIYEKDKHKVKSAQNNNKRKKLNSNSKFENSPSSIRIIKNQSSFINKNKK